MAGQISPYCIVQFLGSSSKSLGFVWKEPFRTLFDLKLIQEISEIEAENSENEQWYARRDLLGTLERMLKL